jgi:hypothetical protein
MWTTLLRFAATALAGWVVSDIYNENQTSKQSIPASTASAAKKNWLKWTVIAVGSGIVLFIIAKIISLINPKIKILNSK